jgi:two-component system, cell cycle sensor histidine kinase and response regulator CckA
VLLGRVNSQLTLSGDGPNQSGRQGRRAELALREQGERIELGVLLALGVLGLGLVLFWALTGSTDNVSRLMAGLLLVAIGLGIAFWLLLGRRPEDERNLAVFRLMAADPAACLLTDPAGQMILRNEAAEARFGAEVAGLHQALERHVLNPGELMLRLQKAAEATGSACEDLPGPRQVLRLTVHRASADRFFWRADEIDLPREGQTQERSDRPVPMAVGSDLEEVPVAIMTFGPDGVMRIANLAARELIWKGEIRAAMFHDLFEGLGRPVSEWLADVTAGRHPGGPKCFACAATRSGSCRSRCGAMSMVAGLGVLQSCTMRRG